MRSSMAAFTTRNVWNLPPLYCWSEDQVPMQDRLTFDAQLSNTSIACFSIESIDWHEVDLHVAEDTVFQKKDF